MNAIVDPTKFQGLEQVQMKTFIDFFDDASLYFEGAAALTVVLHNSIASTILDNSQKASLIGGILHLLDDGYNNLKQIQLDGVPSIASLIEQVKIGLTCLKCAFLSEMDCPNDRLQEASVHALGYLLDQATHRLESLTTCL